MIYTGGAPAQRFRNSVRNVTIDSGRGNGGAVGLNFCANNQGAVYNVTLRSGPGRHRGGRGPTAPRTPAGSGETDFDGLPTKLDPGSAYFLTHFAGLIVPDAQE